MLAFNIFLESVHLNFFFFFENDWQIDAGFSIFLTFSWIVVPCLVFLHLYFGEKNVDFPQNVIPLWSEKAHNLYMLNEDDVHAF